MDAKRNKIMKLLQKEYHKFPPTARKVANLILAMPCSECEARKKEAPVPENWRTFDCGAKEPIVPEIGVDVLTTDFIDASLPGSDKVLVDIQLLDQIEEDAASEDLIQSVGDEVI